MLTAATTANYYDLRSKLSPRRAAGKSAAEVAALEDRSDYQILNNPAFQSWKWISEGDGPAIMLRSDFALHPDVYGHMKNVLGKSGIKAWYNSPGAPLHQAAKLIVKGVDKANGAVKQAMLSLAPFHYVQEATHAVGHRINPLWNLPKLDFADPFQRDAAEHGLVLAGDHHAMENFREGLGAFNPAFMRRFFPRVRAINEFLFNEYIPRLKLKTYEAILRRNQGVYASDLKAGTVTMAFIHDLLVRRQGFADPAHLPVNCFNVADALEVSTKTIKRDLDFLRDVLGAPVEYDAGVRSYLYTEAVMVPFFEYLNTLRTRMGQKRKEAA